MSYAEVCEVRDESQGYKASKKFNFDSPWDTHFVEMGKKTVLRRLFKYLPTSAETQGVISKDELADAGVSQDNALVLDAGDYKVTEVADDEPAREPGEDS
jgi:recombination protein RecT